MSRTLTKPVVLACAAVLLVGLSGAAGPAVALAEPGSGVILAGPSALDRFDRSAGSDGFDGSHRSERSDRKVSFSPSSGGVAETTEVTLKGKRLDEVTEVRFGDRAATILELDRHGRLRVQAPAAASVGYQPTKVPVTVWAEGEPTFAGWFSYVVKSGVDRQLNYAFTYWRTYNDARYLSFNPYGGDCMNFVSQTLAARGMPQDSPDVGWHDGWYNTYGPADSIDNWKEWTTAPWISVSNFDRYLTTKQDELGLTLFDLFDLDRSQLSLGDVVLFEWVKDEPTPKPDGVDQELWDLIDFDGDHAMIVSDIVHHSDGTIDIKLAGHNVDQDFLDLDYVLQRSKIADGHIWHFEG
jgi:hypothetical protein